MKRLIHNLFNSNNLDIRDSFLREIPLFHSLSEKEIVRVKELMYERTFEAGEYIFHMNQPGAAMFFVKEGSVNIVLPAKDKEGDDVEIAEFTKGNFFGELALLDNSPRSATAQAKTHTKLEAVFRGDFENLMSKDPILSSKLYKQLATIVGQRLKKSNF